MTWVQLHFDDESVDRTFDQYERGIDNQYLQLDGPTSGDTSRLAIIIFVYN